MKLPQRAPRALAIALLVLFCATATAGRPPRGRLASGRIIVAAWPYLPDSLIGVGVNGFPAPYDVALLGPGRLLEGQRYQAPPVATLARTTLIAANATGLAMATIRTAPPPGTERSWIAVASYGDGIVVHDSRRFSVLGVLATGGAPSDVAIDPDGRLAATDTDGAELTVATLQPWSVGRVGDVPFGDEVAFDRATHAIFVTNRDVGGKGALTRVTPDGGTSRTITGETAEGIAIDQRRQIVYVANVNDGTVAEVDARSMQLLRRFSAIARVFSLVLSPDGTTLYCISNQSTGSLFAAAGSAIAIDLRSRRPHVIARSRSLTFPIGAALASADRTLFVTDEALDEIYVLDARTLRAKHAPLRTCETPWTPHDDPAAHRLYVPCARANRIDVFDTRTRKRIPGAPFATGSYPLAVTVWHPHSNANAPHVR